MLFLSLSPLEADLAVGNEKNTKFLVFLFVFSRGSAPGSTDWSLENYLVILSSSYSYSGNTNAAQKYSKEKNLG